MDEKKDLKQNPNPVRISTKPGQPPRGISQNIIQDRGSGGCTSCRCATCHKPLGNNRVVYYTKDFLLGGVPYNFCSVDCLKKWLVFTLQNMAHLSCVVCGKEIDVPYSFIRYGDDKETIYFCSKECAIKYGEGE